MRSRLCKQKRKPIKHQLVDIPQSPVVFIFNSRLNFAVPHTYTLLQVPLQRAAWLNRQEFIISHYVYIDTGPTRVRLEWSLCSNEKNKIKNNNNKQSRLITVLCGEKLRQKSVCIQRWCHRTNRVNSKSRCRSEKNTILNENRYSLYVCMCNGAELL